MAFLSDRFGAEASRLSKQRGAGKLRTWLAGRAVLCPTVHPLECGEQARVELPAGPFGLIEAFVHAKPRRPLAEAKPDLLILKLPGTAGRAERSSPLPANLIDDLSTEVWTWNPPGYGKSRGRATFPTLPAASLAFFDAVVEQRRGSHTRVWIFGNSLGSVFALQQASQRAVDGLILRNPPPLVQTISHVATRNRPLWSHGLVLQAARWLATAIPPDLDALQTSPRCHAPAVFVQCEEDTFIPPALQQMIRDRYAGPSKLVRWAGLEHHEVPDEGHLQQLKEAIDWLRAARV